jgi:uncharacterized protein (TIGR03437 family)
MLNEKGCCNSAGNPAVRGAFAALYATGAGQTTPSGIDGAMAAFDRAADYPVPVLPVRVTVGGRPWQRWAADWVDMTRKLPSQHQLPRP